MSVKKDTNVDPEKKKDGVQEDPKPDSKPETSAEPTAAELKAENQRLRDDKAERARKDRDAEEARALKDKDAEAQRDHYKNKFLEERKQNTLVAAGQAHGFNPKYIKAVIGDADYDDEGNIKGADSFFESLKKETPAFFAGANKQVPGTLGGGSQEGSPEAQTSKNMSAQELYKERQKKDVNVVFED